ncbi:MAG: NADH-quinone oxidoreductase subunit NuoE [Acidaminococcales bacterium]|jgi:NADH-quinone oxidoreductase E subunit|nr:NADH-quinone oxidoreductase subunit NuoE [Acidaminococcales bacterium]
MGQGNGRDGGDDKISEQLRDIFDKYRGQQGTLIPILQEAQNRYGYLSREVIGEIARATGNPVSRIYGIVTFYSQFHLKPRGRNIIKVCQGTACHVRGGKKILNFIEDKIGIKPGNTTADLRYTLETVACIGACGLAPVLMVNDDTHGRLTTDLLPWILDRYK